MKEKFIDKQKRWKTTWFELRDEARDIGKSEDEANRYADKEFKKKYKKDPQDMWR